MVIYVSANLPIKRLAYEGAHLVPMETPFVCKKLVLLKTKLLSVNMSLKNVVITGVSGFIMEVSKKDLTAVIPSWFGIFVYKDFTSIVTNIALCGRFFDTVSTLLIKSVVSWTYDFNFLTNGCRWWSTNSEILVV